MIPRSKAAVDTRRSRQNIDIRFIIPYLVEKANRFSKKYKR
jgi:hypothetical protein